MFKIINKLILGKDIKRLDIEAPEIADVYKMGQFVMICPEEGQESIPLTIADADSRRRMVSVIFKEMGPATRALGSLPIHEEIFSLAGPFGKVRPPEQIGTVVCVACDVYAAQLLPICRAYSQAENKVIGVLAAKTKSEFILEPQMRIACHQLLMITEDGSYHRRGNAFELVKKLLDEENVHLVYSIGDADMMHQIADLTREKNIPHLIQVHTLMSCGRGMCGSCRVKVEKKLVLSCEEGPEFDGHQMDYGYLKQRMEHVCCHHGEDKASSKGGMSIFKRLFEDY